MEISVQRSVSSDILRKARSLDLKSVYGDKPRDSSRSSSKSLKSGNESDFGRKRSRKEASLSGFVAAVKRQRNSWDASRPGKKVDDCNRISDSLLNFGRDTGLGTLKKKDDGTSSDKNSENSNGLGDDVVIPKRPRGSSTQRKHETPVDSEVVKESSNCSAEVKNEAQVLIVKRKKKSNRVKENGSRDRSANRRTGEGHVRSRSRSKKASASLRQDRLGNEAHLADDNEKFYREEYDVGNLEENAARMLSSLRFDPRCIGFSGDTMTSSSSPASGYYEKFTSSRPESSSVDAAGRMLRPRRRSGKSLVRKRRHFYEVCLRDMDPYFIIKQRIRVFWPLDKSWYFGLVKDYDPVTGLHHVKYDDRDEEWIDLRSERFKLLLFPSEISGKFHAKLSSPLESTDKAKEGDQSASDGSCLGNFMDSEPIISWLTRSKHHRKLSSTSILKKRREAHILKDFKSSVFLEEEHATVNQSTDRLESVETLPEVLEVKSRTSSFETKVPFVYSRRRFHKRTYSSNKIRNREYILGSSAGSVSIVALAADLAEELNIFGTSVEPKKLIVKFSLRPMSSHDLAFGTKSFSLFHTLFSLQFGVLICLWPMVHMEIVLVDNVMGLKLLVFEGSLRWVVGLLCSIITVFYRRNKQCKAAELRMPLTSIGCKLSGLHDQGANLLFVLYSYLQLEILKWQYLEDKLKQQCSTMWELSIVDCTHSNIKNLLRKADQMLGASVYMNAVSIEGFPERLHSNIMHQIISDKSISLNPSSCFIDESTSIPAQSLSFATSPSFFMSLHLKLLIEDSAASFSIQKRASSFSQDCANNNDDLTINISSPAEDPSDRVSDITIETSGSLNQVVAVPGKSAVTQLKVETDALSFSNDADWRKSSDKVLGSDNDMVGNSNGCSDLGLNKSDETVVRIQRSPDHAESSQDVEKSCTSYPDGSSSPEKSEGEYDPCLNKTSSQSQQFSTVEEQSADKGKKAVHTASNMGWELNDYAVHCIKPTAPRCIWHRNRHSSISPTSSYWSNFWSDEFMQNGFVSGSKKPRTQVSYSFPFGGYDLGSRRRSHQRKARSFKNVKPVNANRVSAGSASARSYHEPLNCDANVLVTNGDRGWRECGALVLLDSDDQKEWRICVKLSGTTKFEYKVQHILQPGITNRHTHAMMWKGGKDWTLEFTDRSQWSLFKEMHEECYNRNIRAAYVKNIPIPGVRLIADADDNVVEAPFVRCPSKYYRQVGTDVDMALDPSHVLYDMDSGDEEWISKMSSLDKDRREMSELTDAMFERVMDTFEKFAYAQQCDEFSVDEIEEFMSDVGELDIVKAIYEHWRQKRLEKGLPLVRQFQPPLWMVYEQQLKDWEFSNSRMPGSHDGFLDRTSSVKKPPIFAFCLRPRGLEIPNKGPKQRSHKKFMSAGCHRPLIREQDGFHTSGKRPSGFSAANKVMVSIPSYESSDSYHSNDGSEKCRYPKFYRNNSRKGGMFPSPRDPPNMSLSCNKKLKRDGVHPCGAGVYELPNMQQQVHQHRADIDEFRLRDASSAAKHALNMAKLKRERAQWLLHKADLAVHKATTALIIADALKESEKDLIL